MGFACGGKGQRGALVEKGKGMVEKYYYNDFFWGGGEKMKTREDKRMVKLGFFKIALFGHILQKFSTFIYWCMVIPLGPHSVYT